MEEQKMPIEISHLININTVVEKMSNEFTKYHIKGLSFDMVLHHFTAPDKGGPHDHPFSFTTHILKGGYIEKRYYINSTGFWYEYIERNVGDSFKIYAKEIHEIFTLFTGDCWTIVLPNKWEREWGFWKFSEDGIRFRKWFESEFKLINNEFNH